MPALSMARSIAAPAAQGVSALTQADAGGRGGWIVAPWVTGFTWRAMTHDLFEHYRPERHYMRGPGPKWRAKHAGFPTAGAAVS